MNQRNFGIVEGRLTKDIVVFDNKDGSKKVMITVAAKDNFKTAAGETSTQFINLEAFVSAEKAKTGLGVYDHMAKGDLVGFEYTVRTNNYKAADGSDVYSQVLLIQGADLKESKKVTDGRHAAEAPAAAETDAPAV